MIKFIWIPWLKNLIAKLINYKNNSLIPIVNYFSNIYKQINN